MQGHRWSTAGDLVERRKLLKILGYGAGGAYLASHASTGFAQSGGHDHAMHGNADEDLMAAMHPGADDAETYNYPKYRQVSEDDQTIIFEQVIYPGATAPMRGYLVRPRAEGKYPAIALCHYRFGVTPYMEELSRRFAKLGYLVLAVDFYAPQGGTPWSHLKSIEMSNKVATSEAAKDAKASLAYLRTRDDVNGKIGMIGYCMGGCIVDDTVQIDPDIDAAVVYYGFPTDADGVANIKASLLLHYADPELDPFVAVPAAPFDAALKKFGKTFTAYTYPKTHHAFGNEMDPYNFNAEAAQLAWGRTVEFLEKNLKG